MMEREPLKVFCRCCHAKLDISDLEPFSRFPCPDCGTMIMVPERFDRYLLEKLCGVGGMAKIYRALDTKLARRVAVKILDRKYVTGRDFFETAKLVAKINHPAVVPVLDCGIFDGRPFMVMKFMENGDLERHFKAGTLPPVPELLKNMASVASCLETMGEKNIIHHDVKPSNILLSGNGEAGLCDFDLADIREPGDISTPCQEWGSPGYMSPERMYSGGEDQRGDIFSLGVTIYELLSGELPFGIRGETDELYRKRQDMEFAALSTLIPWIPAWFSEFVFSMLSFQMENRPGYPEITAALQRMIGELEKKSGSDVKSSGRLSGWFTRKSGE